MLTQMRQWQNVLALTLVLMCVGISIGHHIEASLGQSHGEQCSICVLGSHAALLDTAVSCGFDAIYKQGDALLVSSLEYLNEVWPDYATRAPPLV